MHIIKVPSAYGLKLPRGAWLNLALIRQAEIELEPAAVVRIFWENGQSKIFRDLQALAIIEALTEAIEIDKSHLEA